MSQCLYVKSNGQRCGRRADGQSPYCWQHGGDDFSPLATPTDIPAQSVKKIVPVINRLIADALSLYIKSKNYHWHLYGNDFRDYHLLFDEQANEILSSVDILAERVRKLGGVTIKSINHINLLKTIKDDDDEGISLHQMIARLLFDNRQMARNQRSAITICENAGDSPTANILQEILDGTERRIWFLFNSVPRDCFQRDQLMEGH